MSKSGSVAADRLKSFVERIERLREEKKAIGSDERDVFSEAKGVGFDVKAMREVLKRRAMDESTREEWDTIVDTYEHALGLRGEAAKMVASGATYDQAAEKTGVSRATVARTVASIKNLGNETPPEPAEVVPHVSLHAEPDQNSASASIPQEGSGNAVDSTDEATPKEIVGAVATAQPERVATQNPDDDDLTIPPYLRGSRQSVPA